MKKYKLKDKKNIKILNDILTPFKIRFNPLLFLMEGELAFDYLKIHGLIDLWFVEVTNVKVKVGFNIQTYGMLTLEGENVSVAKLKKAAEIFVRDFANYEAVASLEHPYTYKSKADGTV